MRTTKTVHFHSLFTKLSVLTLVSLLSLSPYAASKEYSGTVTFTGNIVHTPCLIHQETTEDLRFSCLDNHANMQTSYIDTSTLMNTTKKAMLSNQLGSYEVEWVKNDHNKELVKIQYQ